MSNIIDLVHTLSLCRMIALNANYEQYKQLKRIVEQRIKIK